MEYTECGLRTAFQSTYVYDINGNAFALTDLTELPYFCLVRLIFTKKKNIQAFGIYTTFHKTGRKFDQPSDLTAFQNYCSMDMVNI